MNALNVTWWMWVLFGLLLMLGEVLTPGGFFILFFGVGAVLVGFLGAFGLGFSLHLQILFFLALSVLSLVLFRKPMMRRFHRAAPDVAVDSLVGETAIALEDIAVNGVGRAELRGTTWNARNSGGAHIARSQRCRVEKVEGLLLLIRGEQ
jgi:membrane protein implicated in regulation of membrane protease activity